MDLNTESAAYVKNHGKSRKMLKSMADAKIYSFCEFHEFVILDLP